MRVHTLDLLAQNIQGIIAAFLVEVEGELALIETGPGSTLPALLQGLQKLGFAPQDIRHVLVTHIHLDHSGAAGWWAQQGAQVYCHPQAARHLTDPSRLIDSARQVYGERMEALWGDILPVPAERLTVLADGDSVTIGGTPITAWSTPGHARHHHAYVMGDVCFTGDVAGMRLEGSPYLSVTAAPPQFELQAYLDSVSRLLAAGFKRLYLTHFGEISAVQDHLTRYLDRVEQVYQNVLTWVEEGCTPEVIRQRYHDTEKGVAIRVGMSEQDWTRHELSNATAMCADGIRMCVERSRNGTAKPA